MAAAQALTPARSRGPAELPEGLLAYVLLAPAAAVLIGLVAYPLLDGVATAFTDRAVAKAGKFVGFANFSKAINDTIFQMAFKNTVFYTFWATIFKLALGMWLALLLNRRIHGAGLFRTLYFLPVISSPTAVGLLWTWIFAQDHGVLNGILGGIGIPPVRWLGPNMALYSVVVVNVWGAIGEGMIIFLAGLQAIPKGQFEAAMAVGLRYRQAMRFVVLPQALTVTIPNIVNTTIGSAKW